MARFVSPITDMKPNGHLLFFKSGTNSVLGTFKDELEEINNPTDVPVGPDGNLGNVFFSGSAKVKYFDQFNVQYAERDPVGGEKDLGDFSLWDVLVVYDKGDFVEASNGRFYQSLLGANVGNDPTVSESSWKEVIFTGIYNSTVDYKVGEVAQTTDGNLWKSLLTPNINNDPSTDDGTNWAIAVNIPPDLWDLQIASFTVDADKDYQVFAVTGAVNGTLNSSYPIGSEITVHNDVGSTDAVELVNSALTIVGTKGTLSPGDELVLEPGDTAKMVARTTTILGFV